MSATRIGFVSRLEAARTSDVRVQLGPTRPLALLTIETSATGERLRLRLDDGTDVAGNGDDLYGAFRDVEAKLDECWIRASGNCALFVFSEMSYQMSNGRLGYCTIGREYPHQAGPDDIVSVLDACDAFDYGPGARDDE